jgi:Tol biopolymer transport system component
VEDTLIHTAAKTSRGPRGTGRTSTIVALAGAIAAALVPAVASAQFRGVATLADRSGAGVPGDASSAQPSVSADGRYVAFASDAGNLVPGDTNLNEDVFVHDTVTRTIERVSISWQGQEARDDSDSPSISANGRYVAFRSRAWNMYPGGANLGQPVWQIYVHDRQASSTVQVTVPLGGGTPDFASNHPSISADGNWIAFDSAATKLVEGDGNGRLDVFLYDRRNARLARVSVAEDGGDADDHSQRPALSADGGVVAFESQATNLLSSGRGLGSYDALYARDVASGTTELVSVPLGFPLEAPNNGSHDPVVSGDGRFVAFWSYAQNLTDDLLDSYAGVYVRDRVEGTTTLASRSRMVPGPCGAPGAPAPCTDDISPAYRPALSLDGRFLSFLSSSWQFLPANPPSHREQVLLLDRVTGRLRRLSVDQNGLPAGYVCGGGNDAMSISSDGLAFVYQLEDVAAIGLPDANGPENQDVVRLDWTCDERGNCRSLSLCPREPASCEQASDSKLRIRRRPPGGTRPDRFYWRWAGAPEDEGTPFVDPTADGHYHVCLYGGSPVAVEFDAGLPPEEGWKARRKIYRRDGERDPVEVVQLRGGESRSAIVVKGVGPALDLPYLPVAAPQGIDVQLHESTTGRCWGAHFPTSAIGANFAGTLGSGPGSYGELRAEID